MVCKYCIVDNNKIIKLPENLPDGLYELNCDNSYLTISNKIPNKFGIVIIPDYNKYAIRIQTKWKLKIKIRKLKFIKKLNAHINEFRYRPNSYGYLELFNKLKK